MDGRGMSACTPELIRRLSAVGAAVLLAFALTACSSLGVGSSARVEKAKEMMAERCKRSGEKIYKTVSDVEGIFLMKVRPKGINYGNQFELDDPYGRDLGGDGYIGSFLSSRFGEPKPDEVEAEQARTYRYVEAEDPTDGQRYRYTGSVREVTRKSSILIGGDGKEFKTRDWVLDKVPAPGNAPRYGVTYEDISTREEREYWIAGSSLRVVDLETGETLAQRIGYMVDLWQGDRTGGRSPWLLAASVACPAFAGRPAFSSQIDQTRRFVLRALIPSKGETVSAQDRSDALTILRALSRIDTIRSARTYVNGLVSGTTGPGSQTPTDVWLDQMDQLSLDYQMAVEAMDSLTDPTSLMSGLVQAYNGPRPYPQGLFANQFDVAGDTRPSMVANSQYHFGQRVPVFIEDQPLFRGSAALSSAINSFLSFDIRLLVNNFSQNDFGDTHSLVLLVDSLSVQNAILQLLPPATRDSAAASLRDILNQASHLRASQLDFTQGKAEGDVLENVVNALADLLLGRTHQRLNGSPEGNTWASIQAPAGGNAAGAYTGRETFYALLAQIAQSSIYGAVQRGEITLSLNAAPQSLAALARTDFGAFVALYTLSPFALSGGSQALETALGPLWSDTYEQWLADRSASAGNAGSATVGGLSFTDLDRSLLSCAARCVDFGVSVGVACDPHAHIVASNETWRNAA
jgi:hypothetical protein